MKLDLKKPCDDCPFRKKNGIRLQPQRALEIANYFVSWQGANFACHKTTVSSEEDDDGNCRRISTDDSQHCIGGVIFAAKQGSLNQLMRIAVGVGLLDPNTLSDKEHVFDSLEEMLDAQHF